MPAALLAACDVAELPAPDAVVQVYDVRTGTWSKTLGAELEVRDTFVQAGQVLRVTEDGVEVPGDAALRDLADADRTWVAEAAHRVPGGDDWVLVLGDADDAGHWRLSEVQPGERFAFGGRVFETTDANGNGLIEVRATGDVLGEVVDTCVRLASEVIDAENAFAGGSTDTLVGTPNHPFWVDAVRDYVPLGELEVGTVHVRGRVCRSEGRLLRGGNGGRAQASSAVSASGTSDASTRSPSRTASMGTVPPAGEALGADGCCAGGSSSGPSTPIPPCGSRPGKSWRARSPRPCRCHRGQTTPRGPTPLRLPDRPLYGGGLVDRVAHAPAPAGPAVRPRGRAGRRAFERASDGPARTVVVGGFSGFGKTPLVHELRRRRRGRPVAVAAGKFDPFDRIRLYQPDPGLPRADPRRVDPPRSVAAPRGP